MPFPYYDQLLTDLVHGHGKITTKISIIANYIRFLHCETETDGVRALQEGLMLKQVKQLGSSLTDANKVLTRITQIITQVPNIRENNIYIYFLGMFDDDIELQIDFNGVKPLPRIAALSALAISLLLVLGRLDDVLAELEILQFTDINLFMGHFTKTIGRYHLDTSENPLTKPLETLTGWLTEVLTKNILNLYTSFMQMDEIFDANEIATMSGSVEPSQNSNTKSPRNKIGFFSHNLTNPLEYCKLVSKLLNEAKCVAEDSNIKVYFSLIDIQKACTLQDSLAELSKIGLIDNSSTKEIFPEEGASISEEEGQVYLLLTADEYSLLSDQLLTSKTDFPH